MGKFVTGIEDHKRGKALYNMRHGWPHKAAIRPDWLNEWIKHNGPFLYHGTKDEEATKSILEDGLYPHDVPTPHEENQWGSIENQYGAPNSRSTWGRDFMKPRAGHVYMGTGRKASGFVDRGGDLMAIDLRKLNPNQITADEDAFNSDRNGLSDDPNHPINKVWGRSFPPQHDNYYGDNVNESLGMIQKKLIIL